MKHGLFVLTAAAVLALGACKKQDTAADSAAASATPAPATSAPEPAPATAAAPAADQGEKSEAQAKLEYATMEDGYINDAKGQWAVSATASSSYGDAAADSQDSYSPWQVTGAPNGDSWSNKNQDIGFDWIQADFANPTSATAVRVVFRQNVEAISKIELIDTDGGAHTVWSGVSETKPDERGDRTWVVRTFDATPYAVKAVKVTVANPVAVGYKYIDAIQLVGA